MTIAFKKVKDAYGWLGNMSPFPIECFGVKWKTTEALFQALRFSDPSIREHIRLQASPMGAKLAAKSRVALMTVKPLSDQDIQNMHFCLNLKIEQHSNLRQWLLNTGDEQIVEDVTGRSNRGSALFWGAAKTPEGDWEGQNNLGILWEKIRRAVRESENTAIELSSEEIAGIHSRY
jgi:ribA/ribD-fused uncharacterized protein